MPSNTGTPNSASGERRVFDLDSLKAFLGHIGSYTEDLIFPPTRLYHYTDLNGLIGIMEKHDLWLTHSRYSNDEQELELGYQTAA